MRDWEAARRPMTHREIETQRFQRPKDPGNHKPRDQQT